MLLVQYYESPLVGTMTLAEENGAICMIDFGRQTPKEAHEIKQSDLLLEAAKQLGEYFAGKRRQFNLPLAPKGTAFQQKVWLALRDIPYGETRSYKQIAIAVQNPKGCRAVGMANNKNPISIVVPCHRVIGTNGKLVGYGGGLANKIALLQLETLGK